jgi:hypothetical protein
LASSADEGRGTLRKAPTSRVQTLSVGDVRMGKPGLVHARSLRKEREPGELKHLSSPRKRKDSASSGERKRSSPNPDPCGRGVVGGTEANLVSKSKALGRATAEGESPVGV